jgi:hypothetical protein
MNLTMEAQALQQYKETARRFWWGYPLQLNRGKNVTILELESAYKDMRAVLVRIVDAHDNELEAFGMGPCGCGECGTARQVLERYPVVV